MWSKFYDLLKLFSTTAFYIKLLDKTFGDTASFMILFFIALAMFGSSIFMLQSNQEYGKQEELIKPVFGNYFIDLLLNQYLLGLGEFAFDEFEGHP